MSPRSLDTISVSHNGVRMQTGRHTQWRSPHSPPGVDRACFYYAVGQFGMWGGVCIVWRGIRCEVEQKGKQEQDGTVVHSKCYKGWNNSGGRDSVSFRPGSFPSHMEVAAGRSSPVVQNGKYLLFPSFIFCFLWYFIAFCCCVKCFKDIKTRLVYSVMPLKRFTAVFFTPQNPFRLIYQMVDFCNPAQLGGGADVCWW